MPSKTEAWIAAQIAECLPAGPRGRKGIDDLVNARLFLEGRGSQIFGMVADRATFEDQEGLLVATERAIRSWFLELEQSDVESQVALYDFVQRHRLGLDLPEPPVVAARRTFEEERARALSALGTPSSVLSPWPSTAGALARFRELVGGGTLRPMAKHLRLDRSLDVSHFQIVADEWIDVASAGLDPAFLPFADGADGDFLGVYLDGELTRSGIAPPVVYYFHEHDPPYTWVFESADKAEEACRAAARKASKREVSLGEEREAVTRLLAEFASHAPVTPARTLSLSRLSGGGSEIKDGEDAAAVYERDENPFAAANVRAQRLWQSFEARRPAAGRHRFSG